MRLAILAAACLLAACTASNPPPPISASPAQDAAAAASVLAPSSGPSLQGTVTQGLQDASWNMDQAVIVGALDANDPAPACLHSVLTDLGLDPAKPASPAASFVPRVSDLISGGAVLYIRAQQAKKLAAGGGPTFSIPCKALVGQLVIDAGKAAAQVGGNTLPGAGVITNILSKLQ